MIFSSKRLKRLENDLSNIMLELYSQESLMRSILKRLRKLESEKVEKNFVKPTSKADKRLGGKSNEN